MTTNNHALLNRLVVTKFNDKVQELANNPKLEGKDRFLQLLCLLAGNYKVVNPVAQAELEDDTAEVTKTTDVSVDLSVLAGLYAKNAKSEEEALELIKEADKFATELRDSGAIVPVLKGVQVPVGEVMMPAATYRFTVNVEKLEMVDTRLQLSAPLPLPFDGVANITTDKRAANKLSRTSQFKTRNGETPLANKEYIKTFANQTFMYDVELANMDNFIQWVKCSSAGNLEQVLVSRKNLLGLAELTDGKLPMHFLQVLDRVGRVYNNTNLYTTYGGDYYKGTLLHTIKQGSKGESYGAENQLVWLYRHIGNLLGFDKSVYGIREQAGKLFVAYVQQANYDHEVILTWLESLGNPTVVKSYKENTVQLYAAVKALVKHLETGEPIPVPVMLDASFSGGGIIALFTKDLSLATMCNLQSDSEDSFTYAYEVALEGFKKFAKEDLGSYYNRVANIVEALDPKAMKLILMPMTYGSKKTKRDALKDKKLVESFDKFVKAYLPGLANYLEFAGDLKEYTGDVESWVLPDGHVAYRLGQKQAVIPHKFFGDELVSYVKVTSPYFGTKLKERNLSANLVHSFDAFVARQVTMRASYDPELVARGKAVAEKYAEVQRTKGGFLSIPPAHLKSDNKLTPKANAVVASDHYRVPTVEALYALADKESLQSLLDNEVYIQPAVLGALVELADDLLGHEPFNVHTIHDAFGSMPIYSDRLTEITCNLYYQLASVTNLFPALIRTMGLDEDKLPKIKMVNTLKAEHLEKIKSSKYLIS